MTAETALDEDNCRVVRMDAEPLPLSLGPEELATFFAPAARASEEEIRAQRAALMATPLVSKLLDSFPEPAAVMNPQRQIVLANDKLAAMLHQPSDALVGLRMGDAFECVQSDQAPAGCGTTRTCRYCGAARALALCREHVETQVQECHILRGHDGDATGALDLRVWTTPLEVDGETFTVFAIRDMTDENRRAVLERVFFHDVLNAAGGLKNLMELWPHLPADQTEEMVRLGLRLAGQVVDQIEAQRQLAAAERNDLIVCPAEVDVRDLLNELCETFGYECARQHKAVIARFSGGPFLLTSDPSLLRRVLGNLIKNALEASRAGQAVVVTFRVDTTPTFLVHNQTAMSEFVRAQMFRRSFSTKHGAGHGIGSYSAKLLTERYLKGSIDFRSNANEGTTFVVTLPEVLDDGDPRSN